jgi:hypothetical protein
MSSRQQAAEDAVEAGEIAMPAVSVAVGLTDRATRQGCTDADFDAAHRR